MKPTIQDLAYHEAGHVFVLLTYQFPVTAVLIGEISYVDTPPIVEILSYLTLTAEERRKKVEHKIISIYAGVESEYIFNPDVKDIFEREDEDLAIRLSIAYGILPKGGIDRKGDKIHMEFLNQFRVEARRILLHNWGMVQNIAKELLVKKALSGDELESIYIRSKIMQK